MEGVARVEAERICLVRVSTHTDCERPDLAAVREATARVHEEISCAITLVGTERDYSAKSPQENGSSSNTGLPIFGRFPRGCLALFASQPVLFPRISHRPDLPGQSARAHC